MAVNKKNKLPQYIIRDYKNTDLQQVARLIRQTYAKLSPLERALEQQSALNRSRYYTPEQGLTKLANEFSKTPLFYVAETEYNIIGMIRGNIDRIINLFVAYEYHRNKIGSNLLRCFENNCQHVGSQVIRVRSSIIAIPFYTKHGYKKTTGLRQYKGLNVQSMKKILINSKKTVK